MKNHLSLFICTLVLLTSSYVVNSVDKKKIELYQVGEIKTSLLEPDEFNSLYGNSWILMDGRDVSKSEFATLTGMTNVPDARGKFLRMNNNGASGDDYDQQNDRVLGSYQKDSFKSHIHKHQRQYDAGGQCGLSGCGFHNNYKEFNTKPTGGDETKPKNISVNFYIKVSSCKEVVQPCL